jgi:multiple sugar transport system permease protein
MTARRLRARLGVHSALITAAVVVVLPFLWVAAAAFKTQIALLTGAVWFTPTWGNFGEVLFSRASDYLHNFGNSLIVATTSSVLVLCVATVAAYSIIRLRWPGWVIHSLLAWSVVFHLIPPITMVGAWYFMFRTMGSTTPMPASSSRTQL